MGPSAHSVVFVAIAVASAHASATAGGSDECTTGEAERAASSLALLRALEAAGATHAPIAIKPTAYGGLGVFADEAVAAGTVMVQLPSQLMLAPIIGRQAALPLALAHQVRNASSEVMAAYLATLPPTCPNNIVPRSAADQALVAASLHGWKVDLLKREMQVLRDTLPAADAEAWSEEEMEWAACMKLSRAFAGVGSGPVMMPFIDLINHENDAPSCVERGRWVDEAAGIWVAEIVAARDLASGKRPSTPHDSTLEVAFAHLLASSRTPAHR